MRPRVSLCGVGWCPGVFWGYQTDLFYLVQVIAFKKSAIFSR